MRNVWMPVALSLVLAGCGSETPAGGSGAGGAANEAGADVETGAQWAVDVCKSFPAEAAGKAAGLAIAKTIPSPNVFTSGVNVSNCTYSAQDGALFSVGFRHDTSGATTMTEAIAGLTARPDMTGPVEEVPAKVGKAFWTPRLKTLSYLPDDSRMVTVTPPGAKPGGAEPEDKAVAAAEEAALKAKALAIAEAAAG